MTELLKNHTGLMPQHVPRMHMGVPPLPLLGPPPFTYQLKNSITNFLAKQNFMFTFVDRAADKLPSPGKLQTDIYIK